MCIFGFRAGLCPCHQSPNRSPFPFHKVVRSHHESKMFGSKAIAALERQKPDPEIWNVPYQCKAGTEFASKFPLLVTSATKEGVLCRYTAPEGLLHSSTAYLVVEDLTVPTTNRKLQEEGPSWNLARLPFIRKYSCSRVERTTVQRQKLGKCKSRSVWWLLSTVVLRLLPVVRFAIKNEQPNCWHTNLATAKLDIGCEACTRLFPSYVSWASTQADPFSCL